MSVQIRGYRRGDGDQVVALWNTAGIARPWLDLPAEIDEKLKRDPQLFLVAVDGDAVVGAVMGAYDGRRGWIYHLAVAQKIQGQGVGTRLIAELEARMARVGVRKINLQVRGDNAGVTAFYTRAGYSQDELVSMSKVVESRSGF
jgi:ribosomal protein S18 acetylase RimI-like enzyme